ncbi:hypothetical protein [Marinimicrobium sp. ABcell2]|uniref:hypothetical protein n=1 Tax=Marinimicrobium sp. ABcell2 TaxID=3069751 RepID=UPI0027B680CD|nr:hypothetical protein [Marinimicrobium sp. ABcell2]MDQ2076683.1 hypothetical protein [Marinimicrobium sp. ABcell2]
MIPLKRFAIRLFSIVFLASGLTACLEVKDSSDPDLVRALNEQNEILREQNSPSYTGSDAAAGVVTLHGEVFNLATDQPVSDATAEIRIGGSAWGEPVAVTNGGFEIEGLPTASNYILVLRSDSDEFLDRAVLATTRGADTGVVYQDVGRIGVSGGKTLNFYVLDEKTQDPISGLNFYAESHMGSGSGATAYRHTSNFDEDTGEYRITVPTMISTTIRANLDLNGDGERDWEPNSNFSSNTLSYSSSHLASVGTIYLQRPADDWHSLELRISVLDVDLETLSDDLLLTTVDQINGRQEASFDAATQQYVLNVEMKSELEVLLPAFSIGDQHYGSASISIWKSSQGQSFYVSSSGNDAQLGFNVPSSTETLDLVVRPRLSTPSSDLRLVTRSATATAPDYAAKFFYSSPIELLAQSVTLKQLNAITVVRGDDSEDDLVLPGTTFVTWHDIDMDVETSLSLNDTMLTLTPGTDLESGFSYKYDVGTVIDVLADQHADTHNDQLTFSVLSSEPFDINDITLDNNNYTQNGEAIVSENTAGDEANPNNWSSTVYLMLPLSIENLNSLTLRKTAAVRNGNTQLYNTTYNIVRDGNVSQGSKVYALGLAENENLQTSHFMTLMAGAAIEDGYWYRTTVSEHMADDTEASENRVHFDYAYETKDGEVHTGSIELSVQ